MKQLRKTLVLPILDREFAVDVDFRLIEIIERVFDRSADAVVTLMKDTSRIQRSKVADVISGWLAFYPEMTTKRRDVREYVITSTAEQFANFILLIYGALLFTLQYLDEKSFDDLVIATTKKVEVDEEGGEGKKKPIEPMKGSRRHASGSRSR